MSDATGDFVSRLNRLDSCAVSDALDKLRIAGVARIFHNMPRHGASRVAF